MSPSDVTVDGWAGVDTRTAFTAETAKIGAVDPSPWPADNDEAITEFFGTRGSSLVRIQLPYPMRLAWDHGTTVTSTFCNAGVADYACNVRTVSRYLLREFLLASGAIFLALLVTFAAADS